VELLLAVAITALQPADSASELTRRLEAHLKSLSDETARFVQTYRSGALAREIVERGVLSLKPPGRMLFEYKDPEKKTFVSDGERSYFYVPADRQVTVRSLSGERSVLATLLSGRAAISEQFNVAFDTAAPGAKRLLLTPKEADPEVQRVLLELDEGLRIRRIDILDAQGNDTDFRFDDIKENVGLPDRLFRFDVPRGVEVISG